jgi:hypothetical protein
MDQGAKPKASYQKPTIRVLDETEMLAALQMTSAASTWWA